ncbi:crosslink repair DNA glycosylase YcaQ family protein [Amycolatopsis sp. NPDC024027]|uniref:DNA glycosylase AlkZ-like family protein n=1 Tax=Amycolatopsis sp. NPDC024027 TaxID=3154327 RepID=UPI00340CC3AD
MHRALPPRRNRRRRPRRGARVADAGGRSTSSSPSGGGRRAAVARGTAAHDAEALSYAVGYFVPTAQLPPRGVWGSTGPATLTTLDGWLGRPPAEKPPIEDVVRCCLRAFGPASVADVQAWSGLTKLREVVEPMGLRTVRAESGELLYDVEDGLLPDPDTPAPARFLPDGFYRADWRLHGTSLEVTPHDRLAAGERAETEAEGERLLPFLEAGDRSVRITAG